MTEAAYGPPTLTFLLFNSLWKSLMTPILDHHFTRFDHNKDAYKFESSKKQTPRKHLRKRCIGERGSKRRQSERQTKMPGWPLWKETGEKEALLRKSQIMVQLRKSQPTQVCTPLQNSITEEPCIGQKRSGPASPLCSGINHKLLMGSMASAWVQRIPKAWQMETMSSLHFS